MIKLNKSASIRPHRLPPSAWHGHIPFAAWLVEELRPSLFVELGTHHGASYLGICQAVNELALKARCYAIDTWKGDEHAAYYGDSVYDELRIYHDEKYGDFSKLLRCTFDEGLQKFDDGSIDLLHIDGLHTYEAVKHDFESWYPKLSRRAVVLFHDLDERHGDFGVWRLWSEVSPNYPSFAFTHSHGLGMLLVGDEIPSSVRSLADLDSVESAVVANLFASLGRGVQLKFDLGWWRTEVEKVGGKAAECEAQAAALRDEVQRLTSEVAFERNASHALKGELDELKAAHERMLISIEISQKAKEGEFEAQAAALRDEVEQLTSAVAFERNASHALKTELDELKAAQERTLVSIEISQKAKEGEFEAQATALRDEVQHLTSAVAFERNASHALKTELDEFKAAHERVLADAAVAKQALQRQIDEQEIRMTDLLTQREQAIQQQEETINHLRASLDNSLGSLHLAKSERQRLEDDFERHLAQVEQRWESHGRAWEQRQTRMAGDISDRDELIASLAIDMHRTREMLDTTEARVGRAIDKARQRWAPEGSMRGRLVSWVFTRVIAYHDQQRGRVGAEGGELLRAPVGPVGTPIKAAPKDFAAYIDAVEPKDQDLERQRRDAAAFDYAPLVSFVVPIYRLPREILEHTLLSVEAQTYPNWEACLAWADVEDKEGWAWLQQRCSDLRFHLVCLKENGGISHNSNAALEVASGEFVALLDHDDTVTPWALYDMVKALQDHPDADFLYSDKDSISETGECRLNALFKPEWSPEMLHSVNYLTHFNLMRTGVVRAVGAWDPETDGAQDWDIFFKVTAVARKVLRVPSIQYHWRILPTSTSTGLQTKPYAIMAQLRSQKNYFARKGLPAAVRRTDAGLFHIIWRLSAAVAEVFVLQDRSQAEAANVVNVLCVSNLDAVSRITVVHREEPGEVLLSFQAHLGDRFRLVRQDELDWAAISDAVDPDAGSVVILSGRALGLSGGIVDELVGWTQHHPEIAWVGALAIDPQGKVVEAGRVVADDGTSAPMFRGCYAHEYGWFGGALWYRNVRAVSEYAVAFKAEAFRSAVASLPPELRHSKEGLQRTCAAAVLDPTRRGLVNPFAVVYLPDEVGETWDNNGSKYWTDPYFNPAFSEVNPLRLKG